MLNVKENVDSTFEKKDKTREKRASNVKSGKNLQKRENIFSISTLIEIIFLYTVGYFKLL